MEPTSPPVLPTSQTVCPADAGGTPTAAAASASAPGAPPAPAAAAPPEPELDTKEKTGAAAGPAAAAAAAATGAGDASRLSSALAYSESAGETLDAVKKTARHGQDACRAMAAFLQERSSLEQQHGDALLRAVKRAWTIRSGGGGAWGPKIAERWALLLDAFKSAAAQHAALGACMGQDASRALQTVKTQQAAQLDRLGAESQALLSDMEATRSRFFHAKAAYERACMDAERFIEARDKARAAAAAGPPLPPTLSVPPPLPPPRSPPTVIADSRSRRPSVHQASSPPGTSAGAGANATGPGSVLSNMTKMFDSVGAAIGMPLALSAGGGGGAGGLGGGPGGGFGSVPGIGGGGAAGDVSLQEMEERADAALIRVDTAEAAYVTQVMAMNAACAEFRPRMEAKLVEFNLAEEARGGSVRAPLLRLRRAAEASATGFAAADGPPAATKAALAAVDAGPDMRAYTMHVVRLAELRQAPGGGGSGGAAGTALAVPAVAPESGGVGLERSALGDEAVGAAVEGARELSADAAKALTGICACLADVASAEENYAKGLQRILERHGYPAVAAATAGSGTSSGSSKAANAGGTGAWAGAAAWALGGGGGGSMAGGQTPRAAAGKACAELLSGEAAQLQAVWEAAAVAPAAAAATAHAALAEALAEGPCAVISRLADEARAAAKQAARQHSEAAKLTSAARAAHAKASSRYERLCRELRDRGEQLARVRAEMDLSQGGPPATIATVTDVPAASTAAAAGGSEATSLESPPAPPPPNYESPSPVAAVAGGGGGGGMAGVGGSVMEAFGLTPELRARTLETKVAALHQDMMAAKTAVTAAVAAADVESDRFRAVAAAVLETLRDCQSSRLRLLKEALLAAAEARVETATATAAATAITEEGDAAGGDAPPPQAGPLSLSNGAGGGGGGGASGGSGSGEGVDGSGKQQPQADGRPTPPESRGVPHVMFTAYQSEVLQRERELRRQAAAGSRRGSTQQAQEQAEAATVAAAAAAAAAAEAAAALPRGSHMSLPARTRALPGHSRRLSLSDSELDLSEAAAIAGEGETGEAYGSGTAGRGEAAAARRRRLPSRLSRSRSGAGSFAADAEANHSDSEVARIPSSTGGSGSRHRRPSDAAGSGAYATSSCRDWAAGGEEPVARGGPNTAGSLATTWPGGAPAAPLTEAAAAAAVEASLSAPRPTLQNLRSYSERGDMRVFSDDSDDEGAASDGTGASIATGGTARTQRRVSSAERPPRRGSAAARRPSAAAAAAAAAAAGVPSPHGSAAAVAAPNVGVPLEPGPRRFQQTSPSGSPVTDASASAAAVGRTAAAAAATAGTAAAGESEELLRQFTELPPEARKTEGVVESFSCALYTGGGLPMHGRLSLTQSYGFFAGWRSTRVVIPLADVEGVDKAPPMLLMPNAITISKRGGEKVMLGSFLYRDECLALLRQLVHIRAELNTLTGVPTPGGSSGIGHVAAADVANEPLESHPGVVLSAAETLGPEPVLSSERFETLVDISLDCSVAQAFHWLWGPRSSFWANFLEWQGEESLQMSPWEPTARQSSSSSGDDEILLGGPYFSGESFSHGRSLTFLHPRTTFTFIGPRLAPTRQRQAYRLDRRRGSSADAGGGNGDAGGGSGGSNSGNGNGSGDAGAGGISATATAAAAAAAPLDRVVVGQTTSLEGIPMSDAFSILGRIVVSRLPGKARCRLQVGMEVVFHKQTVLRGKIRSGTLSESKEAWAAWQKAAESSIAFQRQQLGPSEVDDGGALHPPPQLLRRAMGLPLADADGAEAAAPGALPAGAAAAAGGQAAPAAAVAAAGLGKRRQEGGGLPLPLLAAGMAALAALAVLAVALLAVLLSRLSRLEKDMEAVLEQGRLAADALLALQAAAGCPAGEEARIP